MESVSWFLLAVSLQEAHGAPTFLDPAVCQMLEAWPWGSIDLKVC
jgi:hypothetical protein